MIVADKPPLDEHLLMHYGVKGMRWGVINEDKSSGRDKKKAGTISTQEAKSKAEYLAVPKPRHDPAQRNARILDNQKKLVDKFSPPESDKGLTPNQKKALVYGLTGALVAGAIIGGSYYLKSKGGPALPSLGLEAYREASRKSQLNAINADFITKHSFDREAFTLPAGHKFYRISSAAEKKFGKVTYASHTEDDFNRYVAHLGHTFSHKVTFQTEKPVKVPSLTTTLNTLQEVLTHRAGSIVDKEETLNTYRDLIGGRWDDEISTNFLSSLMRRGFGAIVDEMDAGVLSESPLLIFDHSSMTSKMAKQMSRSTISKIENLATDFANRK